MRRRMLLIALLSLLIVSGYLLTSDSKRIWPYRHAAQYLLFQRLGLVKPPDQLAAILRWLALPALRIRWSARCLASA
jgi:hypothetical protein